MPRNNKRRRNNHNNNRKKVKQLNGVTVGCQPNNVSVDEKEQSIELVGNQTEMGSDNSKIDCIVVSADNSIAKSENKYELSENENENKIGIDEPNMSNETNVCVDENEKCDDQNRVINQSNDDSANTCHNNNDTGIIESNPNSDNLACKQNSSGELCVVEPIEPIVQSKSVNELKIPKAVIVNCFTYDSCTEETPPPQSNDDDHENAQVKFNENCFGSITDDTNIGEDKTLSDLDKNPKPLVMSDKIAFQPIMQELSNSNRYRVDSPSALIVEKPKLVAVKKSRSMDDNELMIQEMSDTGSVGDNENTPIVSEAESEVESDMIETSPSSSGILVSVQTIPFNGPLIDLSNEEEALVHTLISDTKITTSNVNDAKIQKSRKRAALETHFMPQLLNPKFLDVIKEENSDTCDAECKKATPKKRENSVEEELDDDVFLDNNSLVTKTNAVFPKINLNFSGRRKHVSHLRSPSADVIREEPQCFLVDTKIIDPESVEESCSKWTTSILSEEPSAELVYIGSSSSSASDVNDQDSVGEADVEDSCDDDSDVRIKTPIIGCDEQGLSLIDSGFKPINSTREPELLSETFIKNDGPVVSNDKCQSKSSESCDNSALEEVKKTIDKISDFVTNNKDTNDHIPKFQIGAPCSNHMFPISLNENPNTTNDLPRNEFIRQDSSSSICSSHSHSTSQSQSTARFCATSPTRDIADFENAQYISGASSLTSSFLQPVKTLRQIALETLASMPYGSVILEELAIVAESLSNLTNQQVTPPPIPPKPVSYADQPPPIPPKPLQNQQETQTPPPIPPKPLNMPYPLPDIPFIDDLELKDTIYTNRSAEKCIKFVPIPPSSSPNVTPILDQNAHNSWLGMPTEQDPFVLVCLSPSQRNFIKDNKNPNETNPDLLLEMHNNFVKRRGYHEYTDTELKEMNREKHLLNDDRHNEIFAKNDDNNRLLAIIRDSKQSTGEDSTAHNVKCDTTFEHNNQSGDKMSSNPSDEQINMKPNHEQTVLNNRQTMNQPARTYSNVEKSTYETKKRIENGNVVFEFSNSSKEKSINGNKECSNEININNDDLTKTTMMKSDINLEKNSVSSANNKIPSSPINNSAGNTENAKLNEKSTNQQMRNEKAKSEYFDDKITFKEFDYIPKFFDDCFHAEHGINDFFKSDLSNQKQFFEDTMKQEGSHYSSSAVSPRSHGSLHDWLKEIDEANSPLDNIVKPIVKEENLCKGMGSRVNVRAPRLHTVEDYNETNDKFDEAQRRYEMYVTKQNHIYNRQSMIDQTPITPHVTPQRRKSLPKELQQKQLEYTRKKEQELNYEFDKLEHDRMRLLQEIQEMKVNQHVKDFVSAHKSNFNSSNIISRHQSEAELLRQQMHDEWLNKVAEREERRLQKIIKITRPGEENSNPEQEIRKSLVDMEHEFLNRVKERRHKLKMPSDSDWESGAESQPTERETKEEKVDPKIKVIEGEREADLKEQPRHIKEFASDFTTTTERTDTSLKETTESSCKYEYSTSSATATNEDDIEQTPLLLPPTPTSPDSLQTASGYFPETMSATFSSNSGIASSNHNDNFGSIFDFPNQSSSGFSSSNPFVIHDSAQSTHRQNLSENGAFTNANMEEDGYTKDQRHKNMNWPSMNIPETSHEYHEISDDEAPDKFDLGPSLLDEMDFMFRSMTASTDHHVPKSPDFENTNKKNEITELTSKLHRKITSPGLSATLGPLSSKSKKKAGTVKPISVKDEKILNQAIDFANEISARSMTDLVSENSSVAQSPKRKFSFRFPNLSHHSSIDKDQNSATSSSNASNTNTLTYASRGRNFSEEIKNVPDLQSSISEESRDAYNRLVEKPSFQTMGRYDYDKTKIDGMDNMPSSDLKMSSATLPTSKLILKHRRSIELKKPNEFAVPSHTAPRPTTLPWRNSTGSDKRSPDVDSNPLRILRDKHYPIIRPRVKVNSTNNEDLANNDAVCESPSYLTQPEYSFSEKDINFHRGSIQKQLATKEIENFNPAPLPPPKDRSKIMQTNVKRHVRKHPLIIPGTVLQRQLNKVKTPVEEKNPPFPSCSANSNYNTNSTKRAEVSKLKELDHSYMNQEDLNMSSDKYFYAKKYTDDNRSYANLGSLNYEIDCTDSASLDFESIVENDDNKIGEMSSPEVLNGFVFEIQKEHFSKDNGTDMVDASDEVRNLDIEKKKFEFSRKYPKYVQPKNELADNVLFNKVKDQVESVTLVDSKTAPADVGCGSRSNGALKNQTDESGLERKLNDSNSVSCEDLLEFSDKKPKGRERGVESDEVRIMTKVLGAVASADQFIIALDFIDWDVHKAIKIMMLQKTLSDCNLSMERCVESLQQYDWDLQMTSLKLKGL